MQARQYEWMRRNRRDWRGLGVDEPVPRRGSGPGPHTASRSPLAVILSRAARQLRLREAVQAAWPRVAPPGAVAAARIDAAREGVVFVAVQNAVVLFELWRQQASLERQLGRLVPHLRGLKFFLAGAADEGMDGGGSPGDPQVRRG